MSSHDINVFFSIFIVDHAWLYEPQYAEMQLTHVPGLATRMGRLMGILSEEAVSRRTSQVTVDLSSQSEPVEGRQNPVSNVGSCDLDTVAELPVSDVASGDDTIGSHDPPSPGADSVAFDIPDDVLVAKVLDKMWSYNSSFISPVVSLFCKNSLIEHSILSDNYSRGKEVLEGFGDCGPKFGQVKQMLNNVVFSRSLI